MHHLRGTGHPALRSDEMPKGKVTGCALKRAQPVALARISERVPCPRAERETAAWRRAERSSALSCLNSVNCDKASLQNSAFWKRVWATATNIEHFVSTYGLENCGLFTVTFRREHGKPPLSPKEAQRRVHNWARWVLPGCFVQFIRTREFHENRNPHFHFVVCCPGDIRSGFNFDYYRAVQKWAHAGRRGAKPCGRLNRNPLLKSLHKRLNESKRAYGIGDVIELVPLRCAGEAVGKYLGGYLTKSVAHTPANAKRTRSVCYSRGFSRLVKSQFAWNSPRAALWRMRVAEFARLNGCLTSEHLKSKFGFQWAWKYADAILAIEIERYPTASLARADGHQLSADIPDDAPNVRVARRRIMIARPPAAHALRAWRVLNHTSISRAPQ